MKADKAKVTRLLKTARGQLDGILKMVEEDRYCLDISNQLMATQSILGKANAAVLQAHMAHCVREAVAAGDAEEKLEELADNPAIIRNRRKIRAAVENARVFRDIQRERGTFSAYLWGFTGGGVIRETGKTRSELSDAVSKDLRRRGMTFVGTTIIYAYLQAVGVIDSHDRECFMYHEKGK